MHPSALEGLWVSWQQAPSLPFIYLPGTGQCSRARWIFMSCFCINLGSQHASPKAEALHIVSTITTGNGDQDMNCTALLCESQDGMGEHRESAHQRPPRRRAWALCCCPSLFDLCVSCFSHDHDQHRWQNAMKGSEFKGYRPQWREGVMAGGEEAGTWHLLSGSREASVSGWAFRLQLNSSETPSWMHPLLKVQLTWQLTLNITVSLQINLILN